MAWQKYKTRTRSPVSDMKESFTKKLGMKLPDEEKDNTPAPTSVFSPNSLKLQQTNLENQQKPPKLLTPSSPVSDFNDSLKRPQKFKKLKLLQKKI